MQHPLEVPWSVLASFVARPPSCDIDRVVSGRASVATGIPHAQSKPAANDDDVVITGCRYCDDIGAALLHGTTESHPQHAHLAPIPVHNSNACHLEPSSLTANCRQPQAMAASCQLPWKTVYYGVSAASICRGMGFAEVAHTFHRSYLCIRSFECEAGAPKALPQWAMASGK